MDTPKLIPVESSNIAALGYDEKKEEAYVKFLNGAVYAYSDVSPEQFEKLKSAESIGSYLAKVFKNQHPARKIDLL